MFKRWLNKISGFKTDITEGVPQNNSITLIREEIRDWHQNNVDLISEHIRDITVVTGGNFDTDFKLNQLKLPTRRLWSKEYDSLVDRLEQHLLSNGYKVTIKDRTDNDIYKGSINVSWRDNTTPEGGKGLRVKTANLLHSRPEA